MHYLPLIAVALSLAAPAAASEPISSAAKPADGKEKMVCRREVPIGSLIATRKRCMTKAQWAQLERDGNEEARKMIYDNAGRPSGQ